MISILKPWIKNWPIFAEWNEWDTIYSKTKSQYPIRYFLFHDLPIALAIWKRKFITDPIWWIKYRTTHQSHFLKTGLEPGYYDYDTLIEKGLIYALKTHVETENSWCYKEYDRLPKEEKFNFIVKKLQEFIQHLKDEKEYSTDQWVSEQEKLDLYIWVKTIYENWKEPTEEVGLDSFYEKMKELFPDENKKLFVEYPEPYDTQYTELVKKNFELEEQRRNEVDSMLIRIVKIRHSLWF